MLKVGAIVYLLDKKTQALVPCMVIEKVNSISLEGESTHHVVTSPAGKTLKIENYKSPWFETIDAAKTFLLDTAKKLIQDSANAALKVAKETFPSNESDKEITEITSNIDDNESSLLLEDVRSLSNNVIVDLGNGQTAKVTIPDVAEAL